MCLLRLLAEISPFVCVRLPTLRHKGSSCDVIAGALRLLLKACILSSSSRGIWWCELCSTGSLAEGRLLQRAADAFILSSRADTLLSSSVVSALSHSSASCYTGIRHFLGCACRCIPLFSTLLPAVISADRPAKRTTHYSYPCLLQPRAAALQPLCLLLLQLLLDLPGVRGSCGSSSWMYESSIRRSAVRARSTSNFVSLLCRQMVEISFLLRLLRSSLGCCVTLPTTRVSGLRRASRGSSSASARQQPEDQSSSYTAQLLLRTRVPFTQ